MDKKDKIIQQKMQSHSVENYNTENGWEKFQLLSQKKKTKLPFGWKSIAAAVFAIILGTFGWKYLFNQHKEIIQQTTNMVAVNSEKMNVQNRQTTKQVQINSTTTFQKIKTSNSAKKQHYAKADIKNKQPSNTTIYEEADSVRTTVSQINNETSVASNMPIIDNKQVGIIAENLQAAPKPMQVISINEIEGAAQVLEDLKAKPHQSFLKKIASVQQINNTTGYSTFDKLKITF
ncbi:hypothetical protein A9P82_12905 [Arachidicoccus ginsenosidimutans]|uniref:hypothetical protein n=1 Tax=Arachidicoccus sp. BS20 TaxID=1850526 RepID=UPI0007F0ABFC|nr:hypothetical protein [Arachidicoccus sp. BS20]ANI90103.1 hypothetical protein A9P82_12905 [Arachidicoccus sp. BS20]